MDIRQDDADHNNENNHDGQRPNRSSSSGIAGAVIAILVLIIAAGAVFYFLNNGDDAGSGATATTEMAEYSGAVATVNGSEIAGENLSQQINNLRSSTSTTAQQFKQLPEDRQEAVILEGLINTRLQVQAAGNAGVSVSDEEVETRLETQIEQIGADEFENRLEQSDVTREEVKADLRDQMIVSAYIQQQAGGELAATDQEVQALYEQYSAQISQQAQAAGTSSAQQIPELSQLRPQLEQIVVQQKRQELSSQLLATARANATIEVLLDGVEYPASTSTPAAPAANPAAEQGQPTTPTPAPTQ